MKLSEYFYGMLVAFVLPLAVMSCSDNEANGLQPTMEERYLKIDGHESTFKQNFGAASVEIEMQVESNTLWKVVTESEGGWFIVDKLSGKRDETFTITAPENMNEPRYGYIIVYMVNAEGAPFGRSIRIDLTQEASDVSLSPSSLPQFAPQGNDRQKFEIKANVAWTLGVSYEGVDASKFVTIIPDTGTMDDNGDGTFKGDGKASFYISVADNRTTANRKAFINLSSEVGSYTVEISQIKSEYSFDVSPSEDIVIAAEGGKQTFGILSLSDDGWDVESDSDWVTFTVKSVSTGSFQRDETVATIAPNSSGKERSAKIEFKPKDSRYQKVQVIVRQLGYDAVFSLSRSDSEGVVTENGATLRYELHSSFDWEISSPSWLKVEPTSGKRSSSLQMINVTVEPNMTNENRTGTIIITPLPGDFPGGVMLDPGIFGFENLYWSITQFGGMKPAISVPWLRDGYGMRNVTVEFNFYSPFRTIREAGLRWRRESDTDWSTMSVTPSDGTEATVSFNLSDLDKATKYVAYGFVVDAEGNITNGSVSYPFTTAGQYPSEVDNPTP